MFTERMLIKRNLLIYFRDKSAVVFSVLASIITLLLYVFFINNSMINSMSDRLTETDSMKIFLNALLLCGVISLNAFTIPLSFMGRFVSDKEEGRLKDFFVAPVKRQSVIFAYIVCSVVATLVINLIVIVSLIIYLYLNDVLVLTVSGVVITFLFYLLCNVLFSIFAFFIACCIKTVSAHSNLIGISSALVGFLSGVYMPIGNFGSKAVETVITLFPVSQLNAQLRKSFLTEVIDNLFYGSPDDVQSYYEYFFGIRLELFDNEITLLYSSLYIFALIIIFSILSVKYVRKSY